MQNKMPTKNVFNYSIKKQRTTESIQPTEEYKGN
jgi:hypothetical protein